MNNADVLKLSHKDEDLCDVIVINNGSEVHHDPSPVPCNNAVMKHSDITSESSRKHSDITSESSRKHSGIISQAFRKHSDITSDSSTKHSGITSESSRKHSDITSESSRKHSDITSESSRKHSGIISQASRKHSDIASDSSRKHSVITSESSRKHSGITSDSSRKHSGIALESSRKHSGITLESSRKCSGIISESSRKYSGIISETSRKHSDIISETSRKHSDISSESSRKHSGITSETSRKRSRSSESSRKHSHSSSESSRKHSHSSSESSRKHRHITSESSWEHRGITSEMSRQHSDITSESSGKHHHITLVSSGKPTRRRHCRSHRHRRQQRTPVSSSPLVDFLSGCHDSNVTRSADLTSVEQSPSSPHSRRSSEANLANQSSKLPSSSVAETSAASGTNMGITSEMSRKHGDITSESSGKHHHITLVSSTEHCGPTRKRRCRSHRHRRPQRTSVSSRPLVDFLSGCHDSNVTRSADLTSVERSPASPHSRRSSEANLANQSSKLPSSSAAETSAASGTNMECAVPDYRPIVIEATNISKSKVTYTSSVCSVVDTVIGKKSECVQMVKELGGYVLKVPDRKRRHVDRLEPQTVKAKVSDTLATCIRKQKCSQHEDTPAACEHKQKYSRQEDDTCSVICLGSDDEVEIIDSDPKPQLDCSSVTDVIDTLHNRMLETVLIDLCTPSKNSESPVLTQKYVDHEGEKMRSRSKYKFSEPSFKEYVSVLGNEVCTSSSRPHDVPSVASHTSCQGIVPFASPASASSASDPAVNSGVEKMQDCEVIFISSGKGGNKMNMPGVCDSGLQYRNHSDVRKSLQAIDNQMERASTPSASMYGNNFYNPHPNTVRMGLRPIVIDGSNVAMGHSNGRIFSCRGLQICIDYFLKRNHRVVAFVPQFRRSSSHSQDTAILDYLEKRGLVSFTPSRRIGNQLVIPYDDRYIVQYAAECGGVIVSTDNYRDLLGENPAWRETIEKRLLMFTWVGDVLMFPQDPLGRYGPNLESFLRFPSGDPSEAQ